MSDISSVRIGIVGLGNIGRHHAERLVEQDANLVGGVDVAERARDSFAAEFDVDTFEDHHDLYERVDAVIVTTPNKIHAEYTVDALERGVSVLVEKPLAHTLAEAERVAAAASGSAGICMVGFHTRFDDAVEVLHGYGEAGRFGDLRHVEAEFVRRRGIPGRGTWFTSEDVAGGGALIDIGVHAVDLALYLLGYPEVVEVSAVTRAQFGPRPDYTYLDMWGDDRGPSEFDVEDSASAFVRCADGKSISLEVAWAVNRPTNQQFVLRGTDAGATLRPYENALVIHDTSSVGAPHFVDSTVETRDDDPYVNEQRYFLERVATDTSPDRNTVDQALTVQRVLDAIYRSDDSNRAVALD